jgi:UPF0271 protein
MAGTKHEEIYRARGLEFLAEYYADLEYADDGSLLITRHHVAYDPDQVRERVSRVLAEGVATAQSGADIPMKADCICVHSDTPGAVQVARAVRDAVGEVTSSGSQ